MTGVTICNTHELHFILHFMIRLSEIIIKCNLTGYKATSESVLVMKSIVEFGLQL